MDSLSSNAPMTPPGRGGSRDQLLEAASALMRDTLDVSLAQIGAHASVNPALVKYHFGNKLGLLVALLERDLTEANVQLAGLLTMNLSPTQKMRLHIGGIIRLFFRYPYLQALMMHVMREADEVLEKSIADRFLRPICDAYETMIDEGVAAGEFKPIDPKLFYSYILGACDQIFSSRHVLRHIHGVETMSETFRREYAEQLRTLILTGLTA